MYCFLASAMGNSMTPELNENKSARGEKRTKKQDEEEEKSRVEEENLSTPRKKKLRTTSSYIFETLFINGESSDVTVVALGREWRLHRVYLCQASYFSSMFSGAWKESSENTIRITVEDDNIDEEALSLAFGSLYRDDVIIKPAIVVNVLATSVFLGMDGLIQQCNAVMKETMNSKSVCDYHQASNFYGQSEVQAACVTWLQQNIMTSPAVHLVKQISVELMKQVVKGSSLFVMQVEMDVYSTLKRWMFLQLNKSWSGDGNEIATHTENYFKEIIPREGLDFLDSEQGKPFSEVFRCLRFQHIINDMASTRILEEDRIIPKTWLLPMYRRQWLQMLRVEQGQDKGPEFGDIQKFADTSLRCGRVLQTDGEYCWRWTGYNFGVDLLVSFTNRMLIFKRNTQSQTCPGGVSLQPFRQIIYQLTVASFNNLGHSRFYKKTDVKQVALGKDEEVVVTSVDKQVQFPLHISCNFLVYTPKHATSKYRNTPQKQPAAAGDNNAAAAPSPPPAHPAPPAAV